MKSDLNHAGWLNYTESTGNGTLPGLPYYRPKGYSNLRSNCPRALDCPDWQYEGEEKYASQIRMLKNLGKIVDLNKVVIGLEALATDILTQTQFDFQNETFAPVAANPLTDHYWE